MKKLMLLSSYMRNGLRFPEGGLLSNKFVGLPAINFLIKWNSLFNLKRTAIGF